MISRKQLEAIAETVGGVPVLGCLPGSTAAEAGVRYGDIVLGVNGMPSPTIDDYLQARKLRSDGFELRIFRAGTEFTVFVAFRPPADPLEALTAQLADGRYLAPESSPPEPKAVPS